MQMKRNIAIIGVVLLSIFSGIIGAAIVLRYFLHPEDFCFCSRETTNTNAEIPELVRLKRFLGIKEDLQIPAVYEKVKKELVGVYKKKDERKSSIDAVYTKSDYIASGFILTADGWIVSIIDNPRLIKKETHVIVRGLQVYPIEDIIIDAFSQALFMKIPVSDLPSAKIGSIEENNIGQNVLAISYGGGVVPTNIENIYFRPIQDITQIMETSEKLSEYFLIKDNLGKWYGGGVVANIEGEILGVIMETKNETEKDNIIMIDSLRPAIDSLLKTGKIERPLLGIKYMDISHAVGFRDNTLINRENGILIMETPLINTPAAKAGLRLKDIIIQINGVDISRKKSFGSMVQDYVPLDTITLTILRNNKENQVEVQLGKMP